MPPTTDPSAPTATATATTTTFRWLLDTRPLWRDEPFEQSASRALHLLPPSEQHTILKHIFTADRKLRLASFLLKRLAVHRTLRVPWSAITLSTDQHGKPCYIPPITNSALPSSGDTSSLDVGEVEGGGKGVVRFNVSHQAGLVVLIGSTGPTTEVGIDVVSVNERATRDMAAVRKEGWGKWVDVYAEVFSDAELEEMKWTLPTPVSISVRYQDDDDGDMERTMTLSPTDLVPLSRCSKPDVSLPLTLPHIPSSDTDAKPEPHRRTVDVTINSTPLIASKIRNFYAHWCLKEAYIKMTGEALLAPWLRDLEFRNVRPPVPSSALSLSASTSASGSKGKGRREGKEDGEGEAALEGEGKVDGEGERGGEGEEGKGEWGETVNSESFEIYRCGERISGRDGNGKVRVELTAWEEGFMIGSAVSVSGSTTTSTSSTDGEGGGGGGGIETIEFGRFEELDLERDVLRIAEAGL